MALLKVICWALIFIIRIRFPPGKSLVTRMILDRQQVPNNNFPGEFFNKRNIFWPGSLKYFGEYLCLIFDSTDMIKITFGFNQVMRVSPSLTIALYKSRAGNLIVNKTLY